MFHTLELLSKKGHSKLISLGLSCAAVLFMSLSPHLHAADEPPARLVSVVQVEKRAISPKIMVIGSVHSRHSAELTPGVSGKLTWVQEAGVRVQAGETVAKQEQTRLKLEQAQQQALIEREKLTLKRLTREFDRLKSLMANKHASQTELDKAETERDMAQANLTLAEIKLKLILDDLARTEIKAPFNGIITARLHQAGEDIAQAEAILTMTDPDNLEIRVHAPLKHNKRVKLGDNLHVYHNSGEFEAKIRSLIPVSDIRSQTFEARIDLPLEMQDAFSVGELISLALPIAQKRLTTLVPRDAVVLRSAGAHVFKIDNENKAVKVQVKLGEGTGDWIAVTGDVSEQDRVVIRGAETLQDGQQVKLQTLPTSVELKAG